MSLRSEPLPRLAFGEIDIWRTDIGNRECVNETFLRRRENNWKMVDIICIEKLICPHRGNIMRTTLDLPEDLLIEAMKTTKIETKAKVIITALEELIRKVRISELKTYKGRVDLSKKH